jgi:hypothetical protein
MADTGSLVVERSHANSMGSAQRKRITDGKEATFPELCGLPDGELGYRGP